MEQKEYSVKLTEAEMQCIANSMTAFFNRMAAEKIKPSEQAAQNIMSALHKFKYALENPPTHGIVML